jgi:uncharacterized protein YutE (UPF0331/DUF86 family)
MADLPEEILAEKENVEVALRNLKEALARKDRSVVELTAIGGFLQNIYNGIENILKQALSAGGIGVPRSDTWHQQLLRQSMSSGIISASLAGELRDYLSFRHFFVHGYGFMLDEAKLQDLADRLPDVWARFLMEIDRRFAET